MKRIGVGDIELRKVFGQTMREQMEKNPSVMYLEADLGGAIGTTGLFKEFPKQAFDVGIMEANMIGVASGLSIAGKIPFVHSFGTFSTRRCADQTFISGCYNRANIKIMGSDPGVAAESNGGTYMPFEDIGVYRSFPEITILDIAEPHLLKSIIEESVGYYGVEYIRFPRKEKRTYYATGKAFTIGKGEILSEGKDVTIVASGLAVYDALEACSMLESEGISAEIIDMFTIKPIDCDLIIQSVSKTGCIVTAENHNVIGGLGSAVAEVIGENYPVPISRIGVHDMFGEVGTQKYLKEKFNMTSEDIVRAAKSVMERKK